MERVIYPCFWFGDNARQAAEFYTRLFEGSEITNETPIVVTFNLQGHRFMALNGNHQIIPNPSLSFFVVCESEEELHPLWEGLCEKGNVLMPMKKYDWSDLYGWVEDQFGINWHISLGKISDAGQKISPLMMYCGPQQGKAEEALNFYHSVFRNSSITGVYKYPPGTPEIEGQVMHSQMVADGNVLMLMDSGVPQPFTFNECVSLVIECDSQEEIDYFWDTFTKDGKESMCGWCSDAFGVFWQIIPKDIDSIMCDPERAPRAMKELMKMKKIDIKVLREA